MDENKNLLYFGCDFSGWHNFEKIIKTVATRCHVLKLNAPNSISAVALPVPLGGFNGVKFYGEEREGKGRT